MKYSQKTKVPLQKYWTSRYVWTLTIGLVIITIVSAIWIRHDAFQKRLSMMQFMAEQTAELMTKGDHPMNEDDLVKDFEVKEFLNNPGRYMQIASNPSIFIVNTKGEVIFSNQEKDNLYQQLNPDVLNTHDGTVSFYSEDIKDKLYMVKAPIKTEQELVGWVVFFELKGNLTKVNQQYFQLFLMVAAIALLGWLSIYFLSKRLARPIKDVANAAEKIQAGDYQVNISDDIREKEVYDLVQSFKEMAMKLEHLEDLRSELLAGVTHELKTPITSISGLLQAVDEGVVEGDEAKEFIRISLHETAKMRMMVEDLLAFNAFVANAVPLQIEQIDIAGFLTETIKEWNVQEHFSFKVDILEDTLVEMDYIRLKQIFTNLFNNAKHAMTKATDPAIHIYTQSNESVLSIYVADNGSGIPEEDQPFIFEKFFRGKKNQASTNGFGLGLPYSRMLAQAMGGELNLYRSSSQGTVFEIVLKKSTNIN